MKQIFVYGDNKDDIIEIIEVEIVPEIIVWRGEDYYVKNEELGYANYVPKGKNINDYNGKFYFYFDD